MSTRINQNKHGKYCEKFVADLRNTNSSSYKTFVTLMNKYQRKQMKVQDILSQMTLIIQDKPELLGYFNQLVHPDQKIQEKESSKEELNKMFSKVFAALKSDFPDQFENVVQLFANTARRNLKKEEGEPIYVTISKLFNLVQTDPDIQQLSPEIIDKINDVLLEIKGDYEHSQVMAQNYHEEYDDYEGIDQEFVDNRQKNNRGFKSYEKNVVEEESQYQKNVYDGPKTENQFFEYISNLLSSQEYKSLLKLIFLYSQCIISFNELIFASSNILKNLDKQLCLMFKEIMESRENSRRKNSIFFRQASCLKYDESTKFNASFNESYKRLPSNYPIVKNCTDDEIALEHINLYYISETPGNEKNTLRKPYEEGVLKKHFLKNTFEENLFKAEDERFEFDVNIHQFRMAIKWLERLNDDSTTPEMAEILIEKLKKYNVIAIIYDGHKKDEVFANLEKYPKISVPILVKRLREKLAMIEECKADYDKNQWKEMIDKNFHRSLDHRSFSLKANERRFVIGKNFLNDLYPRNQKIRSLLSYMQKVCPIKAKENLLFDPNFMKLKNYLTPFNTFSGISNNILCLSNKQTMEQLFKELHCYSYDANIPLYIFRFSNNDVSKDIISFIDFFLNYSKMTAIEKEKTKKYLDYLFTVYQNVEVTSIVPEENIYDSALIDKLEKMESLLYPKSFSYAQSAREKWDSRKVTYDAKHVSTTGKDTMANNSTTNVNNTAPTNTVPVAQGFTKIQPKNGTENQSPFKIGTNLDDSKKMSNEHAKSNKDIDLDDNEKLQSIERSKDALSNTKDIEDKSEALIFDNDDDKSDIDKSELDENVLEGDKDDEEVDLSADLALKENQSKDVDHLNTKSNAESDRDSFYQLMYDSSNESHDEAKVKQMSYLKETTSTDTGDSNEKKNDDGFTTYKPIIYLPNCSNMNKQFFGPQNFYVCLRFYYTLFERFLKAWEQSQEIEENSNTAKLTAQERSQLAKDRYNLFKLILMSLIKENQDVSIYEDSLRCIFGKDAGLLFTTDKIISNVIKNLPNDDFANAVYSSNREIFEKDKEPQKIFLEQVKLAMTHQLYLDINENKQKTGASANNKEIPNYNQFRFYYDDAQKNLYVNYIKPIFQTWDFKTIKNLRKYFEGFTSGAIQMCAKPIENAKLPYLVKNYKRMSSIRGKKNAVYHIRNRITYKTSVNKIKMTPEFPNTEDEIHRIKPKKNLENYCISTIIKVTKFRNWVESQV